MLSSRNEHGVVVVVGLDKSCVVVVRLDKSGVVVVPSRTDQHDDVLVVDVTLFLALDVVEIK